MGRAAIRTAVATVVAGTLIALAACGSSKPAYCTDRTNLENSVKSLTSLSAQPAGISALKSQVKTIVSDANSVVSSAKSDFPSQTSAVKTSVDALQSAVQAVPSSPSATQAAGIAARCGRRRELGQEFHGRQPVEVQLRRQSATADGVFAGSLLGLRRGILALAAARLDRWSLK